jgi:hypothetical protein
MSKTVKPSLPVPLGMLFGTTILLRGVLEQAAGETLGSEASQNLLITVQVCPGQSRALNIIMVLARGLTHTPPA